MHFLDVTIINAYIVYKMGGHSVKDFLQCKGSLARTLITMGTRESKRGRPRSATPPSILKKRRLNRVTNEVRLDGRGHWPKPTNIKNAMWCKSTICKRRTKYKCKSCDEFVCPDCCEHFHTSRQCILHTTVDNNFFLVLKCFLRISDLYLSLVFCNKILKQVFNFYFQTIIFDKFIYERDTFINKF